MRVRALDLGWDCGRFVKVLVVVDERRVERE